VNENLPIIQASKYVLIKGVLSKLTQPSSIYSTFVFESAWWSGCSSLTLKLKNAFALG